MRNPDRHVPRGLLLFEVCVAMVVLALAVAGILRSFAQAMWAVDRARNTAYAARLLQEHALYGRAARGIPAGGEDGVLERPAWGWAVTGTPLNEPPSQLLRATWRITWAQGERPQRLEATTWLPPLE